MGLRVGTAEPTNQLLIGLIVSRFPEALTTPTYWVSTLAGANA